jgi:hypothetical protein
MEGIRIKKVYKMGKNLEKIDVKWDKEWVKIRMKGKKVVKKK